MKRILFLCTHNSGRSQMAEAYFNHLNKDPDIEAISAGTDPALNINSNVIELLKDESIETEGLYPKLVVEELVAKCESVYTMGCGVNCTKFSFPITVTEDFDLEDPHGMDKKGVKRIYEELKEKIYPLATKF